MVVDGLRMIKEDNCIIIFVVVADLHWHILWLNTKTCTRSDSPLCQDMICASTREPLAIEMNLLGD